MTDRIYVWDAFIRLFHWSLVALFLTSYISGENEFGFHVYSGYAIITLLLLRIIWGVMGSSHARFTDFVKRPATVLTYLKTIAQGNPKRYLGHNPAGGAMIVALILAFSLTAFSGLKLYGIEEGEGPFAVTYSKTQVAETDSEYQDDDQDEDEHHHGSSSHQQEADEEFWEAIHETGVSTIWLLVILHVLGVVIASRQHGESLVKAMISGYKNR